MQGVSRTRGLRRARRPLRTRIAALLPKVLLLLSEREQVCGITVASGAVPPGMEALFTARVRRALRYIAQYDPGRLTRIQRDVRAIYGHLGRVNIYEAPSHQIWLGWPTVLSCSAPYTAMVIVHEATHGRIQAFGIDYTPAMRDRIEHACVAQEVAFARRLPGGEMLAESEISRLDRPWWTPKALLDHQIEGAKAHKSPSWLLRLITWTGRRRVKREEAALRETVAADSEPAAPASRGDASASPTEGKAGAPLGDGFTRSDETPGHGA
jgi:hypothetical protein